MQTQVVTLDVLKPIGTTVDLSDSFNARVGDKMTPFQLFITEGGVAKDLKGMHPELEAEVGNGALRNGVAVMAAGVKGVHWVGSTNNVTGYNQLTLAFPAEVFPQSGFCYGHLILANNAGVRETSVDIWFQVLDGTPLMGMVADHYDSELQLELAKAKNANDQFSQEMREKYQAEVKKNEDMSAETRASLSKLADDVGHVQSLINAGDVVPRTEYQKNKEATDTAVEANTKELQSHDAQLKQLTASPASDGTAEITNARIGSDEQSSRTYDTLGEAIRDQVGQTTRAIKQSLTSYPAFPFKKEDGVAYSKDGKSTTSASNYYFNIAGSPLVEIKTTVEPYVNFFTFLDASGNVLDYQRNDDKQATVDYVVVPPLKATTLVLGAEAGAQNAHDSVTAFAEKIETGKLYQGSLSSPGLGLESGPLRASLVINSDKYENLVSVDGGYQVSDDHLDTWADKVLIPQGSGVKYVTLRKSDNSAFAATDAYAHCKLVQIPKANIHLKSYENGLTDISDRFRLSYNNIFADDKDYHYYNYNKGIQTGLRVASQFVTVDKPESWLIDLQRGYEVSFVTALRDDEGQNISHEFYDNHDVLKTATNWVPQTDQGNANALDNNWSSDHIYENLYPQGAYALVFRKSDGSLVTINDIWDHIRIYKVDNTVHFPDYYRNHMADRVRTINSKLTNPNDFGFGFITDVHAEFNAKHFPALIDEIRTKTPVDEFMGGGDWATGWFDTKTAEDNKPELLTFFEELRRLFKGVPLLKTIGNHEWAYGPDNSYNIRSQELYGYYLRDEDKMFNDIQWGPDHTYYYWDNQQAKCRYISLNVMDYPDTLKPTGNSDNKEWYFKVGDEQINWLKATLNSVPDGYVVAIESHLVPLSADQFASFPAAKIGTTISNGEDLQAIASAYAAKIGDFASAKGDLLGWFGGHYHADDITVRNGVTYITTIADCMSVWDIPNVPTKEVGTTSEQAFDIATVDRANRKVNLTRIGAGSDRSFTY